MRLNGKTLTAVFAAMVALSASACATAQQHQPGAAAGLAVITLGTAGGPPPHIGRAQPATALIVDGHNYLIDAGEGAGYQLMQAGIQAGSLDAVFISHLHWDHTLGLDYIMASDWMRNRDATLPIYGPPGLDFFVSRQLASVDVGEAIFRAQARQRPPLASLYPAHDIASCDEHEVYRDAQVRVRSICTSHFAQLSAGPQAYGEDRALAYRFDTTHGSITFTGDTGPSEDLARLAKGSDVLVSEVVDLESIGAALRAASGGRDISPLLTHMAHQHLTPEEVGKMATAAGVHTVILTHFVVGEGVDVGRLAAQVEAHFAGNVLVGHDLQRFPVRASH